MSTVEQPLNYQILLYYNFVKIDDPEQVRVDQEKKCAELNLLGRILIAPEGINGTVSGLKEDTEAYMDYMRKHPLFSNIEFKIDQFDRHSFLKLHVRVKEEIVHFGLPQVDATLPRNNYVEPEEFREILRSGDEDIVILDARSSYETKVGKFKGAVDFNLDNFRDLPEKAEELEKYRGKKIYTYCTGGIKCEKVSAWMEDELGFEQVYQLHGGIVRYGKEVGGEDFEGSCYVFDQRVVVPVNEVNPTVVGDCEVCFEGKTEKMVNCANPECNKHFLICQGCADRLEGCCSEPCTKSPKRRVYDGKGYYMRGVNSKIYIENPDPNYVRNLNSSTPISETAPE